MRKPRLIAEGPNDRMSIYVMSSPPYVKVGVAKSVEKRLGDLRRSCPHPIDLVMRRALPRAVTLDAERHAHKLLGQYSHRNEWFLADLDTAKAAVLEAVREAMKLYRLDVRASDKWAEQQRQTLAAA